MGEYSSRSDLSLFQCLKVKQCRCAGSESSFFFPLMPPVGSSLNLLVSLGGNLKLYLNAFWSVRI